MWLQASILFQLSQSLLFTIIEIEGKNEFKIFYLVKKEVLKIVGSFTFKKKLFKPGKYDMNVFKFSQPDPN